MLGTKFERFAMWKWVINVEVSSIPKFYVMVSSIQACVCTQFQRLSPTQLVPLRCNFETFTDAELS